MELKALNPITDNHAPASSYLDLSPDSRRETSSLMPEITTDYHHACLISGFYVPLDTKQDTKYTKSNTTKAKDGNKMIETHKKQTQI